MNTYFLTATRFSVILLIAIFIVPEAISQGPHFRERLEAQKVAFFTEKIDLSPEEAEKFWPVYNNYSSNKEDINRELRQLSIRLSNRIDSMSEDEVEASMKRYVTLKEKEHELFIDYHDKFLAILSPSKVMKVYIAETQFKQYLLREIQMRHRRHGN